MDDYISREEALDALAPFCKDCRFADDEENCAQCPHGYIRLKLNTIPAADVRPVAEISDAVDEVLDYLNEYSNDMPYHIYSALFDLVSGICSSSGADMREGQNAEEV